MISIQWPKSEACGFFSTISDSEEEIGKALITTKALLCYYIDLGRHVVYWSQYFSQLYKPVGLSAWLLHSAVKSKKRWNRLCISILRRSVLKPKNNSRAVLSRKQGVGVHVGFQPKTKFPLITQRKKALVFRENLWRLLKKNFQRYGSFTESKLIQRDST